MSPDGGIFTESSTVTLTSSNPTAKIFYTLDKSTPTAESAVYTQPIVIEDTGTVVKAIAVADGKAPSEPVESKLFTVEAGQVQFEAVGIHWGDESDGKAGYVEQVKVHMTCSTEGSSIYYTLDGSAPTVSSSRLWCLNMSCLKKRSALPCVILSICTSVRCLTVSCSRSGTSGHRLSE